MSFGIGSITNVSAVCITGVAKSSVRGFWKIAINLVTTTFRLRATIFKDKSTIVAGHCWSAARTVSGISAESLGLPVERSLSPRDLRISVDVLREVESYVLVVGYS